MKLGVLLLSQQSLVRFVQLPFKAKTSLKVKRVVRKVSPELEEFEKVRKELLDKYGKVNEKDQKYDFPDPEKKKLFDKEYEELLDSEVELKFEKITFGEIAEENISAAELETLSWMISGLEDPEDEEETKPEPTEPQSEPAQG